MGSPHNVDDVLRRTLEKIGRNVVNLQKMEAMLKFVLAYDGLNGPIGALGEKISERIAFFAKMPMGR